MILTGINLKERPMKPTILKNDQLDNINMENLTAQQKANRAYYAKHAEKIKAQKRALYAKASETKPKQIKPVHQNKKVVKRVAVKSEDTTRVTARRRIEDLEIAKELGIEGFNHSSLRDNP